MAQKRILLLTECFDKFNKPYSGRRHGPVGAKCLYHKWMREQRFAPLKFSVSNGGMVGPANFAGPTQSSLGSRLAVGRTGGVTALFAARVAYDLWGIVPDHCPS
jgi:hypothetical protein